MYPVSQDVINLFKANQYQVAKVEVFTPAANVLEPVNGVSATPDMTIGSDRILQNGLVIDRYCVTGEKIEIGTAIAAELTLKLNNRDGYFDDTVFKDKWLKVQVGIKDWSDSTAEVTWIPMGWFVVDSAPRKLSTLTISALDFMVLTERVWHPYFIGGFNVSLSTNSLRGALVNRSFGLVKTDSDNHTIRAPGKNVLDDGLLQRAASYRADFLGTDGPLPTGGLRVQRASAWLSSLDENARVNRQFVKWCAQLLGSNAYIDYNGRLHFGWLQETGLSITPSDRYSSDMAEDDVTLTGISCTAYGTHTYDDDSDPDDPSPSTFEVETEAQYIAGNSIGIVVDITGNKFLGENSVNTVLSDIYDLVGGLTYRPFEASVKPCPYLWPMDKIAYVDADGVSHSTVITNTTYTINAPTSIASKGDIKAPDGNDRAGTTGSYESLTAQKGVVKSLSADSVEAKEAIVGKLSVEEITDSNYSTNTYTIAAKGNITSGTAHVTRKFGVCYVKGVVSLSGAVSDWTTLLDASKVPAPQDGQTAFDTKSYWGTSFTRSARIAVLGTGGLQVRYGAKGEYPFQFVYPIE